MGNYKFRLSDMIPNAWFYKLKDMSSTTTTSRTRSSNHIKKRHPMISTSSPINPKASDTHFPRHHHSPKLKSPHRSRILTKRETIYKPSPRQKDVTTSSSAACCPASTFLSSSTHHQAQDHYLSSSSFSSSSSCLDVDLLDHCPMSEEFHHSLSMTNFTNDNVDPRPNYYSLLDGRLQQQQEEEESNWSGTVSSSATDIIIDMINDHKYSSCAFDTTTSDLSDELLQLPPILTKPAAPKSYHHDIHVPPAAAKEEEEEEEAASTKLVRRNKYSCSKLNYQAAGHHQLYHNSPRVDQVIDDDKCRKSTRRRKKSSRLRSLAIVKSSYDPEKDFRESMMEMIVENNIRASKDLEDLLASYLSLNSNDYHDLIVKAFEHIWFNLPTSMDHPQAS